MSEPDVNDPSGYYARDDEPSLAWEFTICQSLDSLGSPYQVALTRPRRYGEAVAAFLTERGSLNASGSVVEVGGGYGSLMAALLGAVPVRDVTMVDLSPFFLEKQRAALAGRCCSFVRSDGAEFFRRLDREVDLVVSNENLGDFRTFTRVRRSRVLDRSGRTEAGDGPSAAEARVAAVAERYGLDLSGAPEEFAFNIGAIEYLEALAPRARAVFLSEHGADTVVPAPWAAFVSSEAAGTPRRIPLKGHDEYSVHFGHLAAVARGLGYDVRRLHMMELLGLRSDEGVRSMVRAPTLFSETSEIVPEFFAHVAEYQVMLLTRRERREGAPPAEDRKGTRP